MMQLTTSIAALATIGWTVAACSPVMAPPATPAERTPVIIGYVFPQERLLTAGGIAADKLTHVNYAFADVKDGKVVEGFSRDAENFRVLTGLRKDHPHFKVLVSVGGWIWSKGFSDMALTAESRGRFVESAVEFVRRHDLDGFDVDWEYPGLRGDDNPHRPEDRENFTSLMADLRRALDAEGDERGRRLLLTIAAGAFPDFLAHTEMEKVQASLDFVNLMTYDFYTGGDAVTGHHANLDTHPDDAKQLSGDRAVRDFLAAGVPAHKLVLGVPFYGRAWADVSGEGGPYRPGKPLPESGLDTTYSGLAAKVDADGFVRAWDAKARAPFLWNAARRVFVSYDDPESLRLKSRFVRERGLAGVMFWEYSADRTGVLLDTLASELRGGTAGGPASR